MQHTITSPETNARRARRRVGAAVGAVAVMVAGCGGGTDGSASSDPPSVANSALSVTTDSVASGPGDGTAPTAVPTATEVTDASITTSAAPATSASAAPFDWTNLVYALECGAATEIDLVDGRFAPEQYNSDVESLVVEFRAAAPVPTQSATLVHLGCRAGGATGALSNELYAVMSPPIDSVPPRLLASVVAEPGAVHAITGDGVVVVDDTTCGATDPNCCPSVFRTRQIVWEDGAPVVVDGARPDSEPATTSSDDCVTGELDVEHADSLAVSLLENALANAGFDPGELDGVYDDALVNAVVRYIEFNADNPALRKPADAAYGNLHAEAFTHRVVRAPVLTALGIACDTVTTLPSN